MKKLLTKIFPYEKGNRLSVKQYQKNIALSFFFAAIPLSILIGLWGVISFISINLGIENTNDISIFPVIFDVAHAQSQNVTSENLQNIVIAFKSISTGLYSLLFIITLFTPFIIIFRNSIKRLHDFDRSGWWALMLLIPLVGFIQFLFLFFKSGNIDHNKYGPAPENRKFNLYENFLRIAGVILILLTIPLSLMGDSSNTDKLNKSYMYNPGSIANEITSKIDLNEERIKNSLTDEELEREIVNILTALRRLHFISISRIDDSKEINPNTYLIEEMTLTMDDLNKLNYLAAETERLPKINNEILSVSGLSLDTSVRSLINIHNTWIQYLRRTDLTNLELSEFQYQFSLFNSSKHDVYLNLVQGLSLLPMTSVEFAKNDSSKNIVKENIKKVFLDEINRNFSDILNDSENYYAKTKNRYVAAVIIEGYLKFFNK